MTVEFNATTKLLFIGDSITDCGWKKDPEALGTGYVRTIRDYLAARDPVTSPSIINRGIGGNKISDLQSRWQRDVLDLKPAVVSIFIGINDVWHSLSPNRNGCDIDAYMAGYRDILIRTRQALPDTKIVLCEPSVLWLDQHPGANEKLGPYIRAVHDLGKEFQVTSTVELHAAFNSARATRPDIPWTTDGVHPGSAGHMLIAMTWLAANGAL